MVKFVCFVNYISINIVKITGHCILYYIMTLLLQYTKFIVQYSDSFAHRSDLVSHS